MRLILYALAVAGVLCAGTGRAQADQGAGRAGSAAVGASDLPPAQATLRQRTAEKNALSVSYAAALAAVDELKKQRAGFRRDRDLRAKLSASLELAKALATANQRVLAAQATVVKITSLLVAGKLDAINRELAQPGLSEARRVVLLAERNRVAAPSAPVKKIVVPSMEIDPLADPEELEAQAAALRQSEIEIGYQLDGLAIQEAAALRAEELRRNHARAIDVTTRDDDQPRRGDQQARSARDGADQSAVAPQGGPGGPSREEGGGLVSPTVSSSLNDFGVVLADLVDKKQLAALRGAARSDDPTMRAAVAKATRAAVQARLELLRVKRAEMEARAKLLRQPRR
ncbi:MAG: hypothetical protein KBG15_16835 [Kofleriaceae bacterium]|nr:hypothetical protein [Kofleriaceae bacterium]